MQRTVLAGLVGLLVAIGVTAGSLGWEIVSSERPLPNLGVPDPAVGYAFYTGLNAVLAGENHEAFDRVLAPGFVDHTSGSETGRTAADLIEQVAAFGGSFPGTRIEVRDIGTAGETLIASVTPVAPKGTIAGLPLTVQPLAGGYEFLRVRNGQITERWTAGIPQLATTTFQDNTLSLAGSPGRSLRLSRLKLEPGAHLSLQVHGQIVVFGESGRTRFRMSWMDESGNPQSDTVWLEAGTTLHLPSGGSVQIECDGDVPATFVRFAAQVVTPGDLAAAPLMDGITNELLWTSHLPSITRGSWQVEIGAMHLPDRAVATLQSTGARLLMWSTTGPFRLTVDSGDVSALNSFYWLTPQGPAMTVDAGQAVSVDEGDTTELTAEADSIVWVISIVSSGTNATPAPDSASPVL